MNKPLEKEGSAGSAVALGVAVISLCLGGYAFYRSFSDSMRIYVVDSDTLASSYLAQTMSNIKPGDDPVVIQKQIYDKMSAIQNKLDELGQSGYVIVRKSATLTYPINQDITQELADELDIHLQNQATNNNPTMPPLPHSTQNLQKQSDKTLGSHLD